MNALHITRARLCGILGASFIGCSAGAWAFCVQQSKNGFASLPLVWYLVLVLGPLMGLTCFLAMWRVRAGSASWLWLGVLLLAPQLLLWVMAVDGVLHYLGLVNHGLFFG